MRSLFYIIIVSANFTLNIWQSSVLGLVAFMKGSFCDKKWKARRKKYLYPSQNKDKICQKTCKKKPLYGNYTRSCISLETMEISIKQLRLRIEVSRIFNEIMTVKNLTWTFCFSSWNRCQWGKSLTMQSNLSYSNIKVWRGTQVHREK